MAKVPVNYDLSSDDDFPPLQEPSNSESSSDNDNVQSFMSQQRKKFRSRRKEKPDESIQLVHTDNDNSTDQRVEVLEVLQLPTAQNLAKRRFGEYIVVETMRIPTSWVSHSFFCY